MAMAARGHAGGWASDPACRTESRLAASWRGRRVCWGRPRVLVGCAVSLLVPAPSLLVSAVSAHPGHRRATHDVRPAGNGAPCFGLLVLLPERSRLLPTRTELPSGLGDCSTEGPVT